MTIFFILRAIAIKGGLERTEVDKMNYLATHGHHVFFVTYEQGQHPFTYQIDSRVKHIDLDCRYFTLYRYSLFRRFYEMIKFKHLFKRRIGALVDEYHPDIIVAPTNIMEFMSGVVLQREKARIIIESHAAFTHDMVGVNMIDSIRKWRYLRILRKCHLLIALTQGDAACWRKHIRIVKVVNNPVSFYVDDVNICPKTEGRIIAVGRYNAQKRFDRLINAFALIADKYPLWHIDIFGHGDDEELLRKQIERLDLSDRVRLFPPTDHIVDEYLKSQFFVLSSDYEGFVLVIIEAMACGLPVVSTDCQFGPSDIIEDGVSGLLAQLDAADLAQKMERLIQHDTERNKMAEMAHLRCRMFLPERIMPQWEQAYLSVL